MVDPIKFQEMLEKHGFNFFSGVPDSLMKGWIELLVENKTKSAHVIASNEFEAITLCLGYHLSTDGIGVAYMQNSGLGDIVNPITSLFDNEVYKIPVLLMIGWRGEPGCKDEPQHIKMGKVTIPLLDAIQVPYTILDESIENIENEIKKAKAILLSNSTPYGFIIKQNFFQNTINTVEETPTYEMYREEAIQAVVDMLNGSEIIVATTGKISRELFEYREAKNESHKNDFYTVGSMGGASSIALGIALSSKKKVIVFDGDGSVIMQMGSLATIGHYSPKKFYHIIFDNESHESTGGQPTVSRDIKLDTLAISCGYKNAQYITNRKELDSKLLLDSKSPALYIIKVSKYSRKNLGRPKTTPYENKIDFMENMQNDKRR